MVGYWFYKFAVEDRDIGVVDYELLEVSSHNLFPVVSFCFSDILLAKQFSSNISKVDKSQYLKYLNGELYDKDYEKLDYWNITINLEDYFLKGEVIWSNETENLRDTLTCVHTESFNGPYYDGEFRKCFEISSNILLHRYVKDIYLYYNMKALLDDLDGVYPVNLFYNIHDSGQFLLAPNDPTWLSIESGGESLDIWIEHVEFLRSRSSARRTCIPRKRDVSYDIMVANAHVNREGCRPPYLKLYKDYPLCHSQDKLKSASYSFNRIRKKYLSIACERFSRLSYSEYSSNSDSNATWRVSITYPEYAEIITQSKEVDIHIIYTHIYRKSLSNPFFRLCLSSNTRSIFVSLRSLEKSVEKPKQAHIGKCKCFTRQQY